MLRGVKQIRFSHIIYALVGISFLWPWNALLTASLLAKQKLADNPSALAFYSSSSMSTSTLISLVANAVLLLSPADYFRRVRSGEMVICGSFAVLTVSGSIFAGIPWLLLLLAASGMTSIGCSLVQNGSFAITQRMPSTSYSLSIMIGQGVAGVIPPLVPMLVRNADVKVISTVTFASVCVLALVAYFLFNSKENAGYVESAETEMANKFPERQELLIASKNIAGPIVTILLGFGASLSFPVFANNVESTTISVQMFSPLTHSIWNIGDLLGRLLCLAPQTRLHNTTMIILSAMRFLFIGILVALVHMGNPSDTIYLFIMLAFGTSGGFLVSNAIAYTPSCVSQHLQPAAGEIISLAIAVGSTLGAFISFITAALI